MACEGDRQTVFEWRNDPWIVALSTHQHAIEWADHLRWFERILQSEHHLLFIIESDAGEGMGVIRFDREENDAEVTIYLLQPFTGKGYGVLALVEGPARAFSHWPILERVTATIREDNPNSVKAFTKAGFVEENRQPGIFLMSLKRRET